MKYVAALIFAVLLARIDVLMGLFDKASDKLSNKGEPPQTNPINLPPPEIISMKDDMALTQTPRSIFFNLLDDFHTNPDKDIREKAIEVLRKNPTILGPKLDTVFEGEIFKMTDHIYNKSVELPFFLTDLLTLLQGENLEMVNRFFAIFMDSDFERFLTAYSRTKDTNCMIAKVMGFKVPEEELLNEYIERDQMFTEFLTRPKIDPAISNLAKRCQLVLQLEIGKLKPAFVVDEEATPEPVPVPIIPPVQVIVPPEGAAP